MLKTSLDWRDAIKWLQGYSDALAEKESKALSESYARGYERGLEKAAERRYH